jgi:hypothetical protein
MAIYHGPVPPAGGGDGFFKPLEWNDISIPVNSIPNGTITSVSASSITQVWPGKLVDYQIQYDKDWIYASGMPEDEMEAMFKKEMAVKLAEKLIAEGHILFTKQDIMAENKIRYKAYTWVGNKDFIEQRRKYG